MSNQITNIVLGTTNFGSPMATITVLTTSTYASQERVFELKSTEGLSKVDGIEDRPSIHVIEKDGHRWHGAYPTSIMNQAIGWFREYLDELSKRAEVQEAVSQTLGDLTETVRAFDESLEEYSRQDWRTAWENVKSLVVTIETTLQSYGRQD